MERLTERDEFGNADIIGVDSADLQLNLDFDAFNRVTEALNRLASYEDLEEQGHLIVLPCKVGDTVWFNTYKNNATECVGIQPHEVKRVNVCFLTDGAEIPQWEFGKTVFLTRAEAEKAMEGEKT